MRSHFVDEEDIKQVFLRIKKHPPQSLKEVGYRFNFTNLPIPNSQASNCEEIVGVDGSVKLIVDRISHLNKSNNNYQTYLIDPIVFIRSVSVHSKDPFIKAEKIVTREELESFKVESTDRSAGIAKLESNLLKSRELDHIRNIIEDMDYGSILLLDMALIQAEELWIKRIIEKCRKKGINLVGWVKDSDIKAKDGLLYTTAAKLSAKKRDIRPPWYTVHPHFKDNDVGVFLYHPPWGRFCFRTDIAPSSFSVEEIFDILMRCSKHSLGYPLVLYKAHQNAKITKNDAGNVFRKLKKIAASNGIFIEDLGVKPFRESYLG